MSFTKVQKMLSTEEVLEMLPIDENIKKVKSKNDEKIKKIISGEDDKKLVVIGPCSVDNEKAILHYLEELAKIREIVKDKLFLVPRIYTGKPRTTGDGYKGFIHQKSLEHIPSMKEGILNARKLNIDIIKTYEFPIADELLYTFTYPFMEDLISYVAIGARSVENQQHRLLASGIESAVGMKNPMSGDINVMLNAISSAQKSHNFIYDGYEVDTTGNSFSHAILRGALALDGSHVPNYSYQNLLDIAEKYEATDVKNRAIIVDANHSNSGKDFKKQPSVIKDVLNSMQKDDKLKNIIKGFMIESYLKEGTDVTGKTYGKSITDGCISIDTTKSLLLDIAENI